MLELQNGDNMSEHEIQAHIVQMMKQQAETEPISEEQRINQVLSMMNPFEAEMLSRDLKTMTQVERAGLITKIEI